MTAIINAVDKSHKADYCYYGQVYDFCNYALSPISVLDS